MMLLRSIVYFIFLCISTVVYSIAILAAFSAPLALRCRIANAWGKTNLYALKILCRLNYHIIGWENLPTENCIIMAKHQSAWETIALRGLLPEMQTWVLKRELLAIPFFGWALRLLAPVAIDRTVINKTVKQMIAQGIAALQAGRWVVIFPEGTRVAPGEHKKYGIGAALLAEKSGYPVVPIAHNAGIFWKRRGLYKLPGTIQVVVGPPISTNGKKASRINEEVASWIEAQLERLPITPADDHAESEGHGS
jgi:1-acyl-sn-glycerol-3-phosphate acyltransferase